MSTELMFLTQEVWLASEPGHWLCCGANTPSTAVSAQPVCRSLDRSHKQVGLDQKQPQRQLNLLSSSRLPDAASVGRSKHPAPKVAATSGPAPAAHVPNGKPAMSIQQAIQPDEPLESSDGTEQVLAAPYGESHTQPPQASPAVEVTSATLPSDAQVVHGRAAALTSEHMHDVASAVTEQRPQPDTQRDRQESHSVRAPKHAAVADLNQRSGRLASASREHQKASATTTSERRHAQDTQHGPVPPSGSRPASQHQQPRKRRHFHDEPVPSGLDSGRRRSQTPDVEFGRDAKRSCHAWPPAPAHARHAEHARHADHPRPSPEAPRSMSISPSHPFPRNPGPGQMHGTAAGPYAAAPGRSWDPERLHNSRADADYTRGTHPPGFDRQQDHRKVSWSRGEHREVSRQHSHHRNHDSRFDRRSSSIDRTICEFNLSISQF